MEAEGFGEIKEKEVFEAILSGRVIETYPEDEVKSFGSHRNLLSVYVHNVNQIAQPVKTWCKTPPFT